MKFESVVNNFINRHHLLNHESKYIVALSGGADSVCLLLALHHLGYQIEACHCNFLLRGEESYRDEQFCVDLCGRLNIPLHRIHFSTQEYATLHKVSIEMAARELRYAYFEQLRKDLQAADICVAHHRDDSVETLLINLIRGTGINGLTGISPRNGHIVRPLLDVSREDILAYMAAQQQSYVTDSSNLKDDVVRNKLRLNILPLLKEINPAVSQNITRTAAHLTEAAKVLDGGTDRLKAKAVTEENGCILIDKLSLGQSPSLSYMLFACLSEYGFSGNVIDDIEKSMDLTGKMFFSPTHRLLINRQELIVKPISKQEIRDVKIPETGNYVIDENRKMKVNIYEKTASFVPSKDKHVVTLDADRVSFPLILRTVREGDRFHPFGMKGTKLISDYLTERKLNRFDKQIQLVVADSQGAIIWLVGERTADICKVTEKTSRILQIEY